MPRFYAMRQKSHLCHFLYTFFIEEIVMVSNNEAVFPQYLSSLLTMPCILKIFSPFHRMIKTLLQIPRTNTKAAECSFSYAGPVIWEHSTTTSPPMWIQKDTFKKKTKKLNFFPFIIHIIHKQFFDIMLFLCINLLYALVCILHIFVFS